MKIVTWNVNSIRSRSDLISHFLDQEKPDVLCIQELKATIDQVPMDIFESRGYTCATYGQKRWNGVLTASLSPISAVQCGFPGEENGDARMIVTHINGVSIVNLYCPQGQSVDSPKFEYKLRFYQAFIEWVTANCPKGDAWILTGDFNIAPDPCDVWDVEYWKNVPTYHPKEHILWKQLLDCGYTDLGRPFMPEGQYSFWDYRKAAFRFNKGIRIDHFLGTKSMQARVLGAQVMRKWRKKQFGLKASDHAPVLLELGSL